MFDYQAQVLDVHDGDTIKFNIDMGMYIRSAQSIRFLGVFAPELDEPGGPETRDFVKRWVARHRPHGTNEWPFLIHTEKDNRTFNRYIGVVSCADCGAVLNDSVNRYLGSTQPPPTA